MRRSVPIAIVTSLVFVWAVLWPDVSRADNPPPPAAQADPSMAAAKQHFEAGRNAYNAGDFPNAIREFKAAEALRPSPVLDYNIGLANEKLQRRRVAVRYYHRYLEGAPAAPNRAEVEARIAQLEKEIAAQPHAQAPEQAADYPPPPVAAVPPEPGAPNAPPPTAQADPYASQQPVTTAPSTTMPPQKKRSLWWVWLLVGIGSAAVVTAIVLGVYYGVRAEQVVYYAQPVPATRLDGRRELYDRNTLVPPQQRAPELAPLLQLHF
jgi:hypothetical protein